MFMVNTLGTTVPVHSEVIVLDSFDGVDVRDFALIITVVAYKALGMAEHYQFLLPEYQAACEKVFANRLMQYGSL